MGVEEIVNIELDSPSSGFAKVSIDYPTQIQVEGENNKDATKSNRNGNLKWFWLGRESGTSKLSFSLTIPHGFSRNKFLINVSATVIADNEISKCDKSVTIYL